MKNINSEKAEPSCSSYFASIKDLGEAELGT